MSARSSTTLRLTLLLALASLAPVACGDDASEVDLGVLDGDRDLGFSDANVRPDLGTRPDAAVQPDANVQADATTFPDAAPPDASEPEDLGTPEDASEPEDLGTPGDAAEPEDLGTAEDAAEPEDLGTAEDAGTTTVAATFTDIFNSIISPRCTCHDGIGAPSGLDMSSRSLAYANLVNVATVNFACGTLSRVEPFSAAQSTLFHKVDGINCGTQMPADGPPYLSPVDVAKIESWIDDGAQDN